MIRKIKNQKSKRSQAEVIVTVLLILIGIVAVGLVSVWIINLVKGNLQSTACFDVSGQINIAMENTYLVNGTNLVVYKNSDWLYLGIERSGKDFNLTGFNVVYGNDFSSDKKLKIDSSSKSRVYMVNSSGGIGNSSLVFPDSGEQRTYAINVTSFGLANINKVSLYPIIDKTLECEKADEQKVSLKV